MAAKKKSPKKKLKIRKSIARRFRVTKKGKVLFRGSHVRHLRRKKKKSQLRAQKIPKELKGKWKKKVKKLLGK
jgi:large subunit ribosomal protein L35